MRIIVLLVTFSIVGCSNNSKRTPQRMPQSLPGSEVTSDDGDYNESQVVLPFEKSVACLTGSSNNFASNRQMTINGKTYPADTHFTITQTEDGIQTMAHLEDGSGSESDAQGTYDIIDSDKMALSCENVTAMPLVEDEDGEMQLGEYSLPIDILVAGQQKKPRKRKKGTTYCYREVKRIVRKKITLTGVAAYMANAQLKKAGWKRYSNYKSAPKGSVCVFNKGGKVTSSGGHKYGHIGIKGRGGVINPAVGFSLKRPFLGCYNKA